MLKKILSLLLMIIILPSAATAFGKNKVQYKGFEWYYIQSSHFDIYYYEDSYQLARFTASVAEDAYDMIGKDFNYRLKNRISIIVYKSHNDFQQTNVIVEYMEEGIGGVTELFKNRVVLPFEGDYEQFRHVIHHELTHAIMNDMLYGGNIQSLVTGRVSQVPLWVSEGIAEFESQGWNKELDMSVRDAVVNNYMPPLEYLSYYLPYQGGASVFRYIAETYGREKISELFHRMKGAFQFEKVMEATFGVKMEEFSLRWHRWLKKMYWNDYSDRQIPSEFAEKIIDHIKQKNYLNVSPAVSPDGAYVAFISDRNGYQSIYLYSVIDNKVVKQLIDGTKSESFEELHLLRPGISFSPDSRKLAFTAKSEGRDWIYILTLDGKEKIKKYPIDMDGVYTVSWSPQGDYIAFVGNMGEASDICLLNLETSEIVNLTDDIFSDNMPSWSPDGKKIVFVSNRQAYLSDAELPDNFLMSDYNYSQKDIYVIEVESRRIERVTATPWNENFPVYIGGDKRILFTSDENGVNNIYYMNTITGKKRALTNVVTGIFQLGLTRSFNMLTFVSFSYGGFDIFTVNAPLKLNVDTLHSTYFVSHKEDFKRTVLDFYRMPENERVGHRGKGKGKGKGKGEKKVDSDAVMRHDYTHYVFKPDLFDRHADKKEKYERKKETLELPENKIKTEDGDYYVRRYKIKLSPDYIVGQAGYDTYFGVQGYTQFSFSDLLGDYHILLNTNLVYDLKNSSYSLTLLNMKNRIDYGIGGYHYANYFYSYTGGNIRFRNFGANLFGSYPMSRYRRVDFGVVWYNVVLEYLDMQVTADEVSTVLPQVNYVFDNVLYGYTGPVAGTRYMLSALISPKYSDKSRDFKSITGDFRHYFMFNRNYQFAARIASGVSFGANAQQYFLGGMDNWINRVFKGDLRIDRIDDIYFSSFVTPLRGAYYYERVGDRYVVTNLEFRFPLINLISFGLPPITLGNIRGVAFTDFGTAWYDGDRLQLFDHDAYHSLFTKDLVAGYGLGARLYFFGFLMRFDVAWRYTIKNSSKPIYYFSLGGDF